MSNRGSRSSIEPAQPLVAVVTGGSSGIGLATAKQLSAQGFQVAICGRRTDALCEAQAAIESVGPQACRTFPLDLAEPQAGQQLVDGVLGRFGRLDVLVNNAGFAQNAMLESFADADFEQSLAVNCRAVYATTHAAWPTFMQQRSGVVVNISSLAAIDPFPGFAVYGACKAWVNLFTKAIADEGRPHGINAFAVMLGAVNTPMLDKLFPDFPGEQKLQPDEAADAIVRLLDADTAPASGEAIVVRK